MTEPSAEARKQAMAVALSCTHGRWVGEGDFAACLVCLARALTEKDAKIAEARRERDAARLAAKCAQDTCDAVAKIVGPLKGIHGINFTGDELVGKVAALQGDLAAARRELADCRQTGEGDFVDACRQRDALEATLAAKTAALEKYGRHGGPIGECLDHGCRCGLTTALASSPGSAWLETAREVAEGYEQFARGHHKQNHDYVEYLPFEECPREPCAAARALLDRPEVQRWR